jgi:hypothetical protein
MRLTLACSMVLFMLAGCGNVVIVPQNGPGATTGAGGATVGTTGSTTNTGTTITTTTTTGNGGAGGVSTTITTTTTTGNGGAGGVSTTTSSSSTCVALTCADVNADCGTLSDNCGGTLQCGTCPAGVICGGGGIPNQCIGPCQGGAGCCPRTCLEQNADCGMVSDGCGNILDCGACPPGETCGGGGQPGACGSMCLGKTCGQLGVDCGTVGDGCGDTLHCGNCSSGQTCGGGGVPNVCG